MQKQVIKDFYGRILGYIEEDKQGNKIAYDFYRRILGRYFKQENRTRNFYGVILANGDITSSLVYNSPFAQKHLNKK